MTEPNTATLNVRSADSTGDSTFRATGIAEHWHSLDMEEQGEIFTKEDFPKTLKKVSRKIKK